MEKRFSRFFLFLYHALYSVELVFYASFFCAPLGDFEAQSGGEKEKKRKWSFLRIVEVRLLFILNKLCLSSFDYRFLLRKISLLSLSLGAFNYSCCAWNYHFLNSRWGKVERKKVCTCMTSTISTAHRSQHLDGVENVLCASFSFFPFLWSVATLLTMNNQHDPLGYTRWNAVLSEKNIKLFSGMELYHILRSDVNLPEQYINMHPYAGD